MGIANVLIFLAKTNPHEPAIPNPNNLRCILSENETAILGPERIPFEFKEDGTFLESYTYKACPGCIKYDMNWDCTLEMIGVIVEEMIVLDIAIKHFGLNVQDSYVSARLEKANNGYKEPRISCNRMLACQKIKIVSNKNILVILITDRITNPTRHGLNHLPAAWVLWQGFFPLFVL